MLGRSRLGIRSGMAEDVRELLDDAGIVNDRRESRLAARAPSPFDVAATLLGALAVELAVARHGSPPPPPERAAPCANALR